MQKFVILIIIAVTILVVYIVHRLIKKYFDPGRSFGYAMLYLILHLAAIFLAVFGSSFLIFKSFSLFFKK